MKIEHLAVNVPDPAALADWYVEHLGMRVVFSLDEAPHTRFLADSAGDVMFEVYRNLPDEMPDHASRHPLHFHLAFVSKSPEADKDRLVVAGATYFDEARFEDGTLLVMLRDPWGLAIQLCKRGRPLLDS
ncbi:MAG: VOC family protein [Planctomycetota bacterium]